MSPSSKFIPDKAGILAADCGTSTGLCWGVVDFNKEYELSWDLIADSIIDSSTVMENSELESVDVIMKRFEHLIFNWQVRARIPLSDIWFVYEDFILREGSHSSERSGLSSPRIAMLLVGKITERWPAVQIDGSQTASQAKTTVTPERMRKFGFWEPGRPHENDARRHFALKVRRWLA